MVIGLAEDLVVGVRDSLGQLSLGVTGEHVVDPDAVKGAATRAPEVKPPELEVKRGHVHDG